MIRTRFSPSPSGSLHIGGLRTAFYNYVFAKQNKGEFLLRIEDTDRERSFDSSKDGIMDDLVWAGVLWDGNSYHQSQGRHMHQEAADSLVAKGLAYKKDGAIFFKMPQEEITVHDVILGDVVFPAGQDDFIIMRSNGWATYHLAVVFDDNQFGVTHVIRAQEHLQNCWKHIALQKALGYNTPIYAHIPLIMNQDGSKMSKRQNLDHVNIEDFRKSGFLSWPLLNYISLLGWSPKNNIEIFDFDFIFKHFSLDAISKSSCKFDYEKLKSFNRKYIHNLTAKKFETETNNYLSLYHTDIKEFFTPLVAKLLQSRISTLQEVADFLYAISDIKKRTLNLPDDVQKEVLRNIFDTQNKLDSTFWKNLAQSKSIDYNQLCSNVRIWMINCENGPPLDVLADIIRERNLCCVA